MTGTDPRDGIVRILDRRGATVGSGFLLTADGLIATCAHVAELAAVGPGDTIDVEFLRAARRGSALAEPEFWRPPDREDVALLRWAGEVPERATPLLLRRAAGSAANRFMTYGFPEVADDRGIWGYGQIGNVVADAGGIEVLQLTGTTETAPGFSGGPVIDQTSNRVVGMVSSITPGDRYGRLTETAFATTSETLRDICPPLRIAEICPYRSLDFFAEEHAPFFFGRDRVTERLLAGLRAQPRFLAVLGPSGSGKSSLLRAGLIARLRSGAIAGSDGWDIRALRPNDLAAEASMTRESVTGPRSVILLDQFEETFGMDLDGRRKVGDALRQMLRARDGPTVVLAMRDDFYSHLAEELSDVMEDWVTPNLVNVPAVLTESDLSEIITGPAGVVGLTVEDGLIGALIDDIVARSAGTIRSRRSSSKPGERTARSSVLPLIEFTLTQLWENQDDGVLTRAAYRDMGGLGGAIARWADAVYYGLSAADRRLAQRILSGLAFLGDEAASNPATRRHRFMDELAGRGLGADMADVLGRLVTSRLLVTRRDEASGRVVVELVHDALLSEWRLLRDWLRRDRDFLVWRQELDARSRGWSQSASDEGADWLRGRELERAVGWLQTRGEDIPPAQRAFIEASREARDRQELHERQIREEAEQAQREAERQRQTAETREFVARLRSDAEEAVALLETAPAQGLAVVMAATGRNVARLGGEPLAFVQTSLHAAVRAAKERLLLSGHVSAVTAVAAGPDERSIWSCGMDCTIRLWQVGGQGAGHAVVVHKGEHHLTALAADVGGDYVASGGADGAVRLWRPDGSAGPVLHGHDDAVLALAFVPRKARLVSAGADGQVLVWAVGAAAEPVLRKSFPGYVSAVAAIAESDVATVVTGHSDGAVLRWRVEQADDAKEVHRHESFVSAVAVARTGVASGGGDRHILLSAPSGTLRPGERAAVRTTPVGGHEGFVRALAFPAGLALISAGEDGAVRFWDLAGRPIHQRQVVSGQSVTSLAVLDGGRLIAGGCDDGTVRVWDWLPSRLPSVPTAVMGDPDERTVARASASVPFSRWDSHGDQAAPAWTGHRDGVMAVAFAPDGRRVVSAGWDRELRIWSSSGVVESIVADPHGGASLTSVACSPSGFPVIASGGRDNAVRLWDLSGRRIGDPITGHQADVMAVAFSPDGSLIATASRDLTVRLWSLDGTPHGAPMRGHSENIMSVAFSPDGQVIASGSRDGTVRLWQLDGTPVSEPLSCDGQYVWAVAFSPDGASLAVGGDRAVWVYQRIDPGSCLFGRPRVWRGHTSDVRAVAWHPVANVLVSGGADGTVRLWDPLAGGVARPLRGHSGPVLSVAIGPDGTYAVTGGDDHTVRLWRLGGWRAWLREGYDRLQDHPLLAGDNDRARAVHEAGTGLS
jgi:WD40 repeat protein